MSARYRGIGSALYVREEEDGEWRVMQTTIPLDDADVAAELQAAMGGTWTRVTDWTVPEGEIGKRALWTRIQFDTTPPPETLPDLLPEGPAIELPIPAGEASHAMLAALANLTAAIVALEKVAMACARALDTGKGAP